MTTAAPARTRRAKPMLNVETKVSAYDRVSGLLVALLVLVGLIVALLLLVWITHAVSFRTRVPPVETIDLKGRGEAAEGFARDLEEPGVEEIPDMEPQLAESLEAITDAASTVAASDSLVGNAAQSGTGSGEGDSRAAGPGGDGNADVVPEWERLEARLSSRSLKDYISQLDYFGIELGALDRDSPRIDYARNLSKAKPDRRSGTRDEENRARRLYFIHQRGALMAWDGMLMGRADINTKGRILAQFYPEELRAELLRLEAAAMGSRSLAEVQKTVFGVRQNGSQLQFYVIDQTYRRPPV